MVYCESNSRDVFKLEIQAFQSNFKLQIKHFKVSKALCETEAWSWAWKAWVSSLKTSFIYSMIVDSQSETWFNINLCVRIYDIHFHEKWIIDTVPSAKFCSNKSREIDPSMFI